MVFRQCSIGGVAYRGDDNKDEEIEINTEKPKPSLTNNPPATFDVYAENHEPESSSARPTQDQDDGIIHFHDRDLSNDLEAILSEDPDPETKRHARNLNGFFTVLSLCHTVLTAEDPETGRITYKAQSPDESALVQAAADMGYQFLGRDHDILSLRSPSSEEVEKYELLNILEFTSARKRMSVVARRLDGDDHRLFLMTKGADNVIFERLKEGVDKDIREDTGRHLSQFANEGLRTLTLAYKVINGVYSAYLIPAKYLIDDGLQKTSMIAGANVIMKLRLRWITGKNKLRLYRTNWNRISDCWVLPLSRINYKMGYQKPSQILKRLELKYGWRREIN
jgi:phospholipid-translocating ATPase